MDVQQVPEVVVKERLLSMRYFVIGLFILGFSNARAQDNLQELLDTYNTNNIPYITVEELLNPNKKTILLDARARDEYEVSHLKNAIHVGFKSFNIDAVENIITDKDSPIVVYCSLGVRSEVIANELVQAGYSNVKNLYGGIFEWKNKKNHIFNINEQPTDSIHAYSRSWGKWLNFGIKVYSKN